MYRINRYLDMIRGVLTGLRNFMYYVIIGGVVVMFMELGVSNSRLELELEEVTVGVECRYLISKDLAKGR